MKQNTKIRLATILIVLVAIVVFVVAGYIHIVNNPPETKQFEGVFHGYVTTDSGNQIHTVYIGEQTLKNVVLSDYKIEMLTQFIDEDIVLTLEKNGLGHWTYQGIRMRRIVN